MKDEVNAPSEKPNYKVVGELRKLRRSSQRAPVSSFWGSCVDTTTCCVINPSVD